LSNPIKSEREVKQRHAKRRRACQRKTIVLAELETDRGRGGKEEPQKERRKGESRLKCSVVEAKGKNS